MASQMELTLLLLLRPQEKQMASQMKLTLLLLLRPQEKQMASQMKLTLSQLHTSLAATKPPEKASASEATSPTASSSKAAPPSPTDGCSSSQAASSPPALATSAARHTGSLQQGKRTVSGSLTGGMKETQEMMDLCGEHNITCDIELVSTDRINEALGRLERNDVRYRFVVDIGKNSKHQ